MPARPPRCAPKPTPPGCCAFEPPRPVQDVTAMSGLCKAIGDATRLSMLQMLAMARRPLCVCELERPFGLSQSTISHHLRILREAGLVRTSRRGTWVFYELNREPLALLRKLESLFDPGTAAPVGVAGAHTAEDAR
jgi:ArsR family transcriptional regulator